jgi:proton-coupled amino acid transporter
MTGSQYVAKRMWGRLAKANVEDSDSDDGEVLLQKTPNTKRRIKEEVIKTDIKKLNALLTYFTLFKGFVCTGVIYAPKAFLNGGFVFTSVVLIISSVITTICALMLVEVKKVTGLTSFSEIG